MQKKSLSSLIRQITFRTVWISARRRSGQGLQLVAILRRGPFLCPIAPAAIHVLRDDLPDNRQSFFGGFLGRQGRIRNIAHQLRNVVIDLLLRPMLAVGNGNVDRIGVMHCSGPLTYDVENPSQTVGICSFEEHLADPIAGPHPSAGMFEAINGMMLDMLAAIARKDYEDRRRRQAQGIAKAKAAGRYKGRPEDTVRNRAIVDMLASGQSWNSIVAATGCSRSTLSRLAKRVRR